MSKENYVYLVSYQANRKPENSRQCNGHYHLHISNKWKPDDTKNITDHIAEEFDYVEGSVVITSVFHMGFVDV